MPTRREFIVATICAYLSFTYTCGHAFTGGKSVNPHTPEANGKGDQRASPSRQSPSGPERHGFIGCYWAGANAGDAPQVRLSSTTGMLDIDIGMTRERQILCNNYGVTPGLFMFDDGDGPNAFAIPIQLGGHPFPDGTVVFGKNLMLEQLRAVQQQGYGNFTHIMAAIMAHEWAHIKQFTVIAQPPPGKPMELCADEVAGWYMGMRAAQLWGNVDIKNSIDAFHRIGDFNYNSPQHHGTPEERYNAFGRGLMAAERNIDFATAFNNARRNAGL